MTPVKNTVESAGLRVDAFGDRMRSRDQVSSSSGTAALRANGRR